MSNHTNRVNTSAHSFVEMTVVISPGHVSADMLVHNHGNSEYAIVSKNEARAIGTWLMRYADGEFDEG